VGSLCCGFGRLWCDPLFAEGVPIAVVVQPSAFLLLLLLFCCWCWLRIWHLSAVVMCCCCEGTCLKCDCVCRFMLGWCLHVLSVVLQLCYA
jgi:hypothetical protein